MSFQLFRAFIAFFPPLGASLPFSLNTKCCISCVKFEVFYIFPGLLLKIHKIFQEDVSDISRVSGENTPANF